MKDPEGCRPTQPLGDERHLDQVFKSVSTHCWQGARWPSGCGGHPCQWGSWR